MKILFAFIVCCTVLLTAEEPKLLIKPIAKDCYVYVSYNLYQQSLYPSNSMYVVTKNGVVLLDTPWDSAQVKPLLDSIWARHNQKVVLCIATHWHADRTAGLGVLKSLGIATYSTAYTKKFCLEQHEQFAEKTCSDDTTFTIGGKQFKVWYPGAGHAQDNIVVWLPDTKILYGGCLLKSGETNGIGNTSDADLNAWEISLQKVMKRYPHPKYVIPGHLACGGKELLPHTLAIVRKAKKAAAK